MPAPDSGIHDVTNQSPPFADVNLFTSDLGLVEAVRREGGAATRGLTALGATAGSAEALEIGRLANENPPKLRRFDQQGRPLDTIEFHPAYHDAMALSMHAGLHCSAWDHLKGGKFDAALPPKPKPGAHVDRLAALYLLTQMEPGHICPLTMTNAAVPTLRLQPEISADWLPKILSREYDRAFQPRADKSSVTLGMGMTEKQGGTDVRASTTRAVPAAAGGPGQEYLLTGHKWFMSAPMCDAFLMLAQTGDAAGKGGLSCFLVPRFLPDGTVNPLRLQRLKDKLGNRSNASSEVEFVAVHGWLIGEVGRGVPTIFEMVTHTRLDCAVASAGLMRLALAHALHHCRHRSVFQKKLADQPVMATVLADMALDVEAATALAFRLAGAFDGAAAGDEQQAAWQRLMTPVTKYWVCKMAPALGYEAMECLGGNGYVEEGLAARLYREMPLNAIWEGSGNVMALDVLRVLQKEGEAASGVIDRLEAMAKGDTRLMAGIDRVRRLLADPRHLDRNARSLTEQLALVAAGCLLRAHAPAAVADAFVASRLGDGFRQTYGAGFAAGADSAKILARVAPA